MSDSDGEKKIVPARARRLSKPLRRNGHRPARWVPNDEARQTIVAELGEHKAYWEPFCGSMAVLLAKPVAGHETVNDLNGHVVNLGRCLQDADTADWLFSRLQRTLLSEDVFEHERRYLDANSGQLALVEDGGDRALHFGDLAYAWLVVSWMGRNGVSGLQDYNGRGVAVRWTHSGGHGGRRFATMVDSIPAWVQRLRAVTILRRDAFELLERIEDQAGTAIYCDPPYLVKGAKYEHDFEDGDHGRLAALLARFGRARVVVSYYDHPRLAELYPPERWTHRKIEVSKALAHQGPRGRRVDDRKAVEVLLINGESVAAPAGGLFGGMSP